MNGGSPMTPRNARTGEFTPPGNSVFARASSRRDRSVFRDDMAARFSAAARDGKEQREAVLPTVRAGLLRGSAPLRDRKSTRLNSSHLVISYAVFCLKKKKKTHLKLINN